MHTSFAGLSMKGIGPCEWPEEYSAWTYVSIYGVQLLTSPSYSGLLQSTVGERRRSRLHNSPSNDPLTWALAAPSAWEWIGNRCCVTS